MEISMNIFGDESPVFARVYYEVEDREEYNRLREMRVRGGGSISIYTPPNTHLSQPSNDLIVIIESPATKLLWHWAYRTTQ